MKTGPRLVRGRKIKRRVAIIGLGNPLMGDDGAGIAVLDLLASMTMPNAELVDAGTGGMQLLHLLAKYDDVILVDAVDMRLKPGEFAAFSPDKVVSTKETGRLSLHENNLFEVLNLAHKLNQYPDRVVICAIQPRSIRPKEGLSKQVNGSLRDVALCVASELGKLIS